MPRPVHFEIATDDPERSIAFYREVFGWNFQAWNGPLDYWLITTGPEHEPGINGGLLRRREPAQPVINTLEVPSVDAYLAKIEAEGGKILLPKTAIPGVGYLAYFADPDGNAFGIMSNDLRAGIPNR